MSSYQNLRSKSFENKRKSLTNHQQDILNSPNFPDLDIKTNKQSLTKNFLLKNWEKQNISKFTLDESQTSSSQTGLKIEDLKAKKHPSFRYKEKDESHFSKLSLKGKQILKQKIEEDYDGFYDFENMGVGFQNIMNNNNNNNNNIYKPKSQYTIKSNNNNSKLKFTNEKTSIQTFNTENMSFESETKDCDHPSFINKKISNDYTKIFIPVIMEEKEDFQDFKEGFLEIGDSIVDLYKIEGVLHKTEKHIVYSAIGLSNNNEEEKFRVKMYNHLKKDAFDFGLAEIANYLYLYEKNINFKKFGVSKLRDYFYLNESLFTVTENIGNPISSLNKNHLNLATIKDIILKTISAVKALHENNLIHLNLNFNSILYKLSKQSKIEISIVDFNKAKILNKRRRNNFTLDNYSAPEQILGMEIDHKVDMWSIGCILYELLTNEALFPTTNHKNLIFMIKKLFSRKPLVSKNEFDKDNSSFFEESDGYSTISPLSKENTEINIKINDIKYNLNILKENTCLEDFLLGLLKVNPNRRYSAQEALDHPWLKSQNLNFR